MQRCNCTVRLNGDLNFTVSKLNVSAAEVAVLRQIHGSDAVVEIKILTNDKTAHGAERDALAERYGAKVIETLWPGLNPRLPVTLREIGIGGEAPASDDDATEGAA